MSRSRSKTEDRLNEALKRRGIFCAKGDCVAKGTKGVNKARRIALQSWKEQREP
jgi:hypothetical protein